MGGFGIALMLTAIIGVVGVYYMHHVGKIIHRLATQEIPETSAVMETERRMWNTHVLSYDFGINLDERSKKKWFEEGDNAGKAADRIVPIATALNHQATLTTANDVRKRLGEYEKIAMAYTLLAMKNEEIRKHLEKSASAIEKQWEDYINGQNEKMEEAVSNKDFQDIKTCIIKLKLGNEAIDLYNLVRKHEYQNIMYQRRENAEMLTDDLNKLVEVTKNTFSLSMAADDVKKGEVALEYVEKYTRLMDQWMANKKKQVELSEQSDAAAKRVIGLTTKTALQADKDAYDAGMEVVNLVSNVRLLLLGLLIGAVLIGSALAFFITRSITKPMNRVIEGLNEGAGQVTSASEQVSSASQSLAEGSSEQAASIEETSSSLEEMASMTKQNEANANEARAQMEAAGKLVEQVDSHMKDMASAIEEITRTSDKTGKIIKTIDEIAFQTNLLALNAAVEAARAGEAGAGFAVVAEEVRNLAMRSADAAKNTSDLIENTLKAIKNGSELTTSTQEVFQENMEISVKIGELVDEIAAASDEQAKGVEQVNVAVAEMDKVVQQNAANAEESASASEEMNAQAEQMKGVVNDLVAMVRGADGKVSGKQHRIGGETMGHRKKSSGGSRKNLSAPRTGDAVRALAVRDGREVKPEQVIPFDDKDFGNF